MRTIFDHTNWIDHPQNPIIKPSFPEWIIADPAVLTPQNSFDNRWHLFANSLLGIHHFVSLDGISWSMHRRLIKLFGVRPFIFIERGRYYLLFEKIITPHSPFHYDSLIQLSHSSDLHHWSKPITILKPDLPWHKTTNTKGNIGNPCLIKIKNTYHLYYSAGLKYLEDCKYSEPAALGLAKSDHIFGPYTHKPNPIDSVKPGSEWTSAMRVTTSKNHLISIQTRIIPKSASNPKSTGYLRLAKSKDGITWKEIPTPVVFPNRPWKKGLVYAADIVRHADSFRIYYNARSGRAFGKESIGVAISQKIQK